MKHNGLIPWKPGQSGNPKGRPKGKSLKDMLWKILDEKVDGVTRANRILRNMAIAAENGSLHELSLIWDHLEGKPAVTNVLMQMNQNRIEIPIPTTDDRLIPDYDRRIQSERDLEFNDLANERALKVFGQDLESLFPFQREQIERETYAAMTVPVIEVEPVPIPDPILPDPVHLDLPDPEE